MLQTIRDYFSGIFSWIILLMITVPFAMWGVNEYTDGGGKTADVAQVNGVGISKPEFLNAMREQQTRMKETLGQAFDPETLNTPRFKRQVLDQLIDRRLVEQAAASSGLDIGDAGLGSYIKSIPEFQRDGAFSPARYETYLRNQGLSAAAFENRVRDSLRVTQLRDAIINSAVTTPADLENLISLRDQRRDIAYLVLPYAAYLKGIKKVEDKDVSAYYEGHRDDYKNPEQVQVEYIDFSVDALAAGLAVDEKTLRRYYDEQAASLTTEEQRRASHILIQAPAKADARVADAARATLAKIQARLKAGESFDALAKQYSQDKASAVKGGDLGFFGKGVMDKDFEGAVFRLQKGQVSEPVRSAFGWHLIRLADIKPARRKSFEESRTELEQNYRRGTAEQQYYDRTEGLADLVYEQPDSLDPAARLLQTTVSTSDWLTRDAGAGVGAYPEVIKAAFSDEVLIQGNNSEPIEVAPGHIVVVRIKEHRKASQKPLAEVRAKIIEILRAQAAQARVAEDGDSMLQRLDKGEKLAALAAESKLTLKDAQGVRRSDPGQPPAVVAAVFRLARPEQGKLRHGVVKLENGDYAVLQLKAVHDGTAATLSGEDRLSLQRELARTYSEGEFLAMLKSLRAQAKIKVWEDRL